MMPATNTVYWSKKIEGNSLRDKRVNRELKKAGWRVIRLWEGDIRKSLDKALSKILGILANSPEGS
jgi:DNA mismatch endonuclease (patch repair protein)